MKKPLMPLVRRLVSEAIGSVCGAAVVRVHGNGELLYEEAFGRQWPHGSRTAPNAIFDLASLTKIYVTTAALALADARAYALDDPVVTLFPGFRGKDARRASVTIRHLLTHASGLPAHVNFREAGSTEAVIARVCSTPLTAAPGAAVIYSDLGFMLLGAFIERLTGESLADVVDELVCRPLDLGDSMFKPGAEVRRRLVCTEHEDWRQRLLRGEVHDGNAAVMGAIAGHAGMFGSAADVARLAEAYRCAGALESRRVLSRHLANEALRLQAHGNGERRGLGWSLHGEHSSCGPQFSVSSFGHTGFTGTSVWVDPERGLTVVLLTNRVLMSREPQPIHQLRVAVHSAVLAEIGADVRAAAAR